MSQARSGRACSLSYPAEQRTGAGRGFRCFLPKTHHSAHVLGEGGVRNESAALAKEQAEGTLPASDAALLVIRALH